MNAHREDRIRQLLQDALPPVTEDAAPGRDLWPAVQARLNAYPAAVTAPARAANWVWFDGALAAALLLLVAVFPAAIPVFLFYL